MIEMSADAADATVYAFGALLGFLGIASGLFSIVATRDLRRRTGESPLSEFTILSNSTWFLDMRIAAASLLLVNAGMAVILESCRETQFCGERVSLQGLLAYIYSSDLWAIVFFAAPIGVVFGWIGMRSDREDPKKFTQFGRWFTSTFPAWARFIMESAAIFVLAWFCFAIFALGYGGR